MNTTTFTVTLPDQILRDLLGIAHDEGLDLNQTLTALISGYKKSSQETPMPKIKVVPLRPVPEDKLTPQVFYSVNNVLHSIMNPHGATLLPVRVRHVLALSSCKDHPNLTITWKYPDGPSGTIDRHDTEFIMIKEGTIIEVF